MNIGRHFLIKWLCVVFVCQALFAQASTGTLPEGESTAKPRFAFIPIPNYNEATGFGLGAIAALFYPVNKADTVSPPSSSTLFGFYAKNKTNVLGAAQKLHLKKDTYRLTLAFARASINFQYFSEILGGIFIDYNTGARFGLVKAEMRVHSDFFLGFKYRYSRSRTQFDIPIDYDPPQNTYSGLGPTLSYDSRDNIFGAHSGAFIKLETLFNHSALGSEKNYSLYNFEANRYLALKSDRVLALRFYTEIGTGDVPFEDQAILGMTDLRGYTSGKYRADQLAALQAEYRWRFYRKFGLVVFAGVGWVADTFSRFRLEDTLPGAGLGLRYMMIPQYGINVGVDFAVGKDDTAFYFRITEAF
jgi:outer membrane protein assembly factor BamA